MRLGVRAGLEEFKAAIAREDQQVLWLEFCSAQRLMSSLFFCLIYPKTFPQKYYFLLLLKINRSKKLHHLSIKRAHKTQQITNQRQIVTIIGSCISLYLTFPQAAKQSPNSAVANIAHCCT